MMVAKQRAVAGKPIAAAVQIHIYAWLYGSVACLEKIAKCNQPKGASPAKK